MQIASQLSPAVERHLDAHVRGAAEPDRRRRARHLRRGRWNVINRVVDDEHLDAAAELDGLWRRGVLVCDG
jgi:hypothetical protein